MATVETARERDLPERPMNVGGAMIAVDFRKVLGLNNQALGIVSTRIWLEGWLVLLYQHTRTRAMTSRTAEIDRAWVKLEPTVCKTRDVTAPVGQDGEGAVNRRRPPWLVGNISIIQGTTSTFCPK